VEGTCILYERMDALLYMFWLTMQLLLQRDSELSIQPGPEYILIDVSTRQIEFELNQAQKVRLCQGASIIL